MTATLRGQDVGKGFIMIVMILFVILVSIIALFNADDAYMTIVDLIRMF